MLNLLATILLCMGLANVSPFNHAKEETAHTIQPKKSTVTTNYEIIIEATNRAQTITSVQGTGNSFYPNGNIKEYKWNLINGNSYINVIGNIYLTNYVTDVITEDNTTVEANIIDNVETINNVGLRSCVSYMMKLTPYNYNVDTESRIRLEANINTFTDINNEDFYAYELYYYRYIYYTPSDNWDEYIGRQISTETTSEIKYEIENINNGFYYTLRTDLIQIGYNERTGTYTDEIELEIAPKTDNYYFIIYRPCCRFVYNTNEQTQPMNWGFHPRSTETIKITGTNIVPNETYEVVNIPGLMFDVLTMPFAFVSQAFNLTLFPGTPYQINIANLFLSIIAILVFVWLMKKFTKL